MYTRAELASEFTRLGVKPGDAVMLHASIRAVGAVAGGPDQIHLALKDALTDAGTLMMYVSCPQYYDEVGRGHLTAELERETLRLLGDAAARAALGEAARRFVLSQQGATERTLDLLDQLIQSTAARVAA